MISKLACNAFATLSHESESENSHASAKRRRWTNDPASISLALAWLLLSGCVTRTVVIPCEIPPAPVIEGRIVGEQWCLDHDEVKDLARWIESLEQL